MLFLGISGLFGGILILKRRNIVFPIGGDLLLGLIILNGVFCFNAPDFIKAIGYELWFIMLAGGVFLACNIFDKNKEKDTLSKLFVLQFVIMSIVGFVQFLVGLFGISFFTGQWTKSFLPRLNGFNYEPSYYASYLLIGWIFLAYLFEKNDRSLLNRRTITVSLIIISGAIVFSTSRMGWLMIALWCLFRLGYTIIKDKKAIKNVLVILSILSIFLMAVIGITNLEKPLVEYFSLSEDSQEIGSEKGEKQETETYPNLDAQDQEKPYYAKAGFHSSDNFTERYLNDFIESPSVQARFLAMILIFMVFIKSPLIGYSLGGVTSAVIENYPEILSIKWATTAICVSVEMLAAFGIIGFAIVLYYLFLLLKKVKDSNSTQRNNITLAWMWAFVWELGILQFNQNILRLYLWGVLAILCVYIKPERVFNLQINTQKRYESIIQIKEDSK